MVVFSEEVVRETGLQNSQKKIQQIQCENIGLKYCYTENETLVKLDEFSPKRRKSQGLVKNAVMSVILLIRFLSNTDQIYCEYNSLQEKLSRIPCCFEYGKKKPNIINSFYNTTTYIYNSINIRLYQVLISELDRNHD